MLATCGLVAIAVAAMAVAGRISYTSIGVDLEAERQGKVLATFHRLRWPGDGSFWIGSAAYLRDPDGKPLERFDLGALVFAPPRRPEPRSSWNRLGFWWVDNVAEDPFAQRCAQPCAPAAEQPPAHNAPPESARDDSSDPTYVRWIAMPAWLPALLFGAWPAVHASRRALWARGLPRR